MNSRLKSVVARTSNDSPAHDSLSKGAGVEVGVEDWQVRFAEIWFVEKYFRLARESRALTDYTGMMAVRSGNVVMIEPL